MRLTLAVTIGIYLILIFALALMARRRVKTEEDYLVAGRRLPLPLATATLLATWFGAGTLLTATDEIRAEGLRVTALEPYGAGLCLILAGLFFAKPLWEMKLCTVSDLYRNKFGTKVETLSVLITVPGYIGWIAVQLVALAGIAQLFFEIPPSVSIPVIALITTVYTLIGGMWSVTITDAVQMALIIPGLFVLGHAVLAGSGDGGLVEGFRQIRQSVDPEDLVLIPRDTMRELVGWVSVLAVSALGNLPGQDLFQRVFASKSARVARNACLISGALYIVLGTIPALLGVAAKVILPEETLESVLLVLAVRFLSPAMTVILTISLVSVILSTVDSAILAPAATLARNGLRRYVPDRISSLTLSRFSVVLIGVSSTVVALWGENAYSLLEESYALGLVGLFVPFFAGVFLRARDEGSAMLAMGTGMLIWTIQFFVETDLPIDLIAVLAGFAVYFTHSSVLARSAR